MKLLMILLKQTPASFEPALDYVVTKIPRFNFERFRGANTTLTTQMKSVGEVMAIGRTFQEATQKALRGLELNLTGFAAVPARRGANLDEWRRRISIPTNHRLTDIYGALTAGMSAEEIHELTNIDAWFIDNLVELFEKSVWVQENIKTIGKLDKETLWSLKRLGFGDKQLANLTNAKEDQIFALRQKLDIKPAYKMIDTCAAEFSASTPYLYSTYEGESEVPAATRPRILILGGGPNRIGQGIEFDYCCVHASMALRELDYEAVMVNSNPETVSTDYDVSSRLYFEPLTLEDVTNIALVEKPLGIIVQLGGQTPLKLAHGLEERGFKILGTSTDSIDAAEDRARFGKLVKKLGLKQPDGAVANTVEEAFAIAKQIGYPLLVRPSYVLGGRSMAIIYSPEELTQWLSIGFAHSDKASVLIDQFLEKCY